MPKWIQELRPTLALAFPIMLAQVSQMLMGITDSVMIGRVGTVELAAASFVGAVFALMFVGCIGLLQPGLILVARERGAERPEQCGVWQRHARALAWAAGLGLSGLLIASLLVAALRWWLRAHPDFRAAMAGLRAARLERARLREMLGLGLPMGATLFFEGGAFSAAAVMAGWLGTVPLAAHQIAISCAALTFMIPLGLSLALAVRTGQAVGEGRLDRARPMATGAALLTCATAALSTLALVLAGEAVARGFVKDDAAVVALAARALVVVGVFQLFDGLQVVFAGALRGLADVRVPLAVSFAAYWGLALPAGYLFGVRGGGGLIVIWSGLAAGLALATLALGWRLAALTRDR